MQNRKLRKLICRLGAVALLAFTAPAAAEEVLLGLGYDRSRNGHGFDLHKVGDTYILYFYTYDQDGHPEWLLGVAEMDHGVLAGDFLRYEYDEDSDEPLVQDESFSGDFRLDFTKGATSPSCMDGFSRNNAVQLSEFNWRIEGESGSWCTEFLRTNEAFNDDPYYGGVWYGGEEDSGYGFTMTHMGDRVTALVYYYDSEGQPRWALGVARDDEDFVLLENYEGFCRTCNERSTFTTDAGRLRLNWSGGGLGGGINDEAELEVDYPLAPFGEFNRSFRLFRLSDGEPVGFWTRGAVLPEDVRYAAAWQEDRADEDAEEVIASTRFGDLDAERTVNVTRAGAQAMPSIAMAADGSYVVTWEDDQDGNGFYQIHARVLNADGTEKVPTFTVNTVADGQQRRPDVSMTAGGDFVIVWEDDQQDDGLFDIAMRGFNANGGQRFSQRVVNSTTTGQQDDPAIAMDEDGNFVVTWADDQDANGFYEVAIKGFQANGSLNFDQSFANSLRNGQQYEPDIAMAPSGQFVVVWNDDNDLNTFTQIHYRGFDANGNARYRFGNANKESIGSQVQPAVAMAADGSFVATWVDRDERIATRSFLDNGDSVTDDVVVNADTTTLPANPAIGLAEDGSQLVVWSMFRDDGVFRVLGNTVSPDGEAGTEFPVSAVPGGSQAFPAIAVR